MSGPGLSIEFSKCFEDRKSTNSVLNYNKENTPALSKLLIIVDAKHMYYGKDKEREEDRSC